MSEGDGGPEKRTGLAHATAYASFRQVLSRPVVYGSLWAGCPVRDRSNLRFFPIIPIHHRRDDRAIVAVANNRVPVGPVDCRSGQPGKTWAGSPATIPDPAHTVRLLLLPLGMYVKLTYSIITPAASRSVVARQSQRNRAGMIPLARLWAVYLLLRISGAPTRPGGRSCE